MLTDKIALVTGASRGIGQAIANELGARGATVIGTATSAQGAEKISQHFVDNHINGKGLVLNVTERDSIDSLIKTMNEVYGMPNIVVNNAAITRDNIMLRMKDDEWNDIINTNLNSVYYLTKACLKAMVKARWGRIISIASVVAQMGNAGQANYAAAKAGVIGFSKSLAQEVASRGITVNVIAPGFVNTDMIADMPEKARAELLKLVPMGRMAEPIEIAKAVAFLADDGAAYITGETIHVNGGLYMN